MVMRTPRYLPNSRDSCISQMAQMLDRVVEDKLGEKIVLDLFRLMDSPDAAQNSVKCPWL